MNSSAACEPNHCDCCSIHERRCAFFGFLGGDVHRRTALRDASAAFYSSKSSDVPAIISPKHTRGECLTQ